MLKIDGVLLKQMIISGANNLYNHYPEVDSLNVFPVPDGDTGTNMNLTMTSGLTEIQNSSDASVYNIAKSFSRGLLMGARGNSGVILSQIFRGFAQGLKGKDEVDALELASAFDSGRQIAYKAVMSPVEGTILTVVREASTELSSKVRRNMPIDEAMQIFLDEAKASLIRTPDLLPVLKEVGVVDSGGAGFVKIIEGFLLALQNKIVQRNMADVTVGSSTNVKLGGSKIGFGKEKFYRINFVLALPVQEAASASGKKEFIESRFSSILQAHGKENEVKVNGLEVQASILTQHPGNILSYAQQFGEFASISIDTEGGKGFGSKAKEETKLKETAPVVEEKKEEVAPKQVEPLGEKKKYGMISCCSGKGIEEIFKAQNVDQIVSGGQTMNPSTQDFVAAVGKINADVVFIFPNNSNIILAANQASEIISDKKVIVIPTKTIPEGIVSSMMFNPEVEVDENTSEMNEAISTVKTGQVTFAIRDTSVDGVEVHKDDYMGLSGKKILISIPDKIVAAKKLLEGMVDDMSSVITIICGEDVTPEEKEKFVSWVDKKYGNDVDIDVKDGLQPVYSFIIGVE